VPALPDMLRRSIFGDYPVSFLSGASAVRLYLKGPVGEREGWVEQNEVNCDLLHTPFSRTAATADTPNG